MNKQKETENTLDKISFINQLRDGRLLYKIEHGFSKDDKKSLLNGFKQVLKEHNVKE
jgi:hypothetical protein